MKIYFDYASTTPLLPEVKEAMIQVMNEVHGNPSSIHFYGRKAKATIEECRKSIAHILNASIGEIFFTSGASESNNMVFNGAVNDLAIERIITSKSEHHCVLHSLENIAASTKTEVIFLDIDKNGFISYEYLEQLLQSNNKKTLVSIMHANNEIGCLHDLERLGKMCLENGALFHTDAAQSFAKYDIDLSRLNISFLSAASHKIFGPKGTGMVYINNGNMIKPMILGGAQERNMRAGTENTIGIVGFAQAAKLAYENREQRAGITKTLRDQFIDKLKIKLPEIEVNGGVDENYLYNVANISFPSSPKADLLVFNLDIAGIAVSSGSACASGIENDSHVLKSINHDPNRKAIRFSFSHLNTEEEIDFAISKIAALHN